MAKTWYPVIEYLTCVECGICVANCPHGVYDSAKAPSPVVTNPEAALAIATDAGIVARLEQLPMLAMIPAGHR
ncbi:MAG TPA: 4Fe-4S binding protein [Clostridiales bacterium]|nr:4Fe-4S binding protein [Clostridiales bacterium]